MSLFSHIPDDPPEAPTRQGVPMRPEGGPPPFIVVSYGGGTDSTALLVEAHRRGIRPDLVVFADTGSERPHTYDFLKVMGEWLAGVGFPEIQVARWYHKVNGFVPLHVRCLERSQLPSKAYGHVGCTSKWKQDPLDKMVREHPGAVAALAEGRTVERWLGYDATEGERYARLRHKPPPFVWRAPLFEWNIARSECKEIIAAAGLPQPGKSSCWMCPMMNKSEVDDLAKQYPHLAALALDIERKAADAGDLGADERGLGLRIGVPWRAWLSRPPQEQLFPAVVDEEDDADAMPCGCHD